MLATTQISRKEVSRRRSSQLIGGSRHGAPALPHRHGRTPTSPHRHGRPRAKPGDGHDDQRPRGPHKARIAAGSSLARSHTWMIRARRATPSCGGTARGGQPSISPSMATRSNSSAIRGASKMLSKQPDSRMATHRAGDRRAHRLAAPDRPRRPAQRGDHQQRHRHDAQHAALEPDRQRRIQDAPQPMIVRGEEPARGARGEVAVGDDIARRRVQPAARRQGPAARPDRWRTPARPAPPAARAGWAPATAPRRAARRRPGSPSGAAHGSRRNTAAA